MRGSARPIKVLLIAPGNEILGGQTIQADRLMKILGEAPEIEIRRQAINPLFPAPLRWVKQVPVVRTMLTMVLFLLAVARKALWADILHIFTAGLSSYTLWTIPAMVFAKLYGKKIVINYRDGRGEDHLRRYRTAKPTLAWADRIISPSGYIVDLFARYGLKAGTINNVIEGNRFIDRHRSQLQPILMTNRSLEPLYNVDCILRAFSKVLGRYPEASLIIAHEGPEQARLEQLAKDLQLRNYRFIGKVAPRDVPKLYDSADIYITTPNIDCMPGSLLEAMASGIPIVATNTGGIPYMVTDGKNALLVELNDDQAVAQHVLRLLEDPALVERLTEDARRELTNYGAKPIRDQWIALYQDLMHAG